MLAKPNKTSAIVLLLGLLLATAVGFSYNIGNQQTYLVDGLRQIDPSLLSFDWFATKTTHYHDHFALVLLWLNYLMPLDIATVLLNVALIILSVWGFYRLVLALDIDKPMLALTMLVALMILSQSAAVGGSYIYSAYLQPSSIASVFWCLAMVYLVKQRWLYAGGLLLLSGYFHTNFLLLGLCAFGLFNLLLGRSQFILRCSLSMGPGCLYLLALLPGLLQMSTSEYAEQSRYIYQYIRSPHHYVPMTYLTDFVKYAGMSLIGVAYCVDHWHEKEANGRLVRLFLVMIAMVSLATLLTTVVYVPFVSQLFPWRFAPFSNLLAQLMLVLVTLRFFTVQQSPSRKAGFIYATGLTLVLTYYLHRAGVGYVYATPIAVLCCGMTVMVLNRFEFNWVMAKMPVVAVALLCFACLLRLPGSLSHSTLLHPPKPSQQALFDWFKVQTPINAQVLIPPDFDAFRLGSERAVVADWKSPPILPDEVIQWYQRMEDISGVEGLTSLSQAKQGYRKMDKKRLEALKAKYHLSYAVFNHETTQSFGQLVFTAGKYQVFKL